MQNNIIASDATQLCKRVSLNSLCDKTILVTGASGLLGTYFLATLVHLRGSGMPFKVIAQVRSKPEPHTIEMIDRGGFELVQMDIADYQKCCALPTADVIIHAAGYAQPTVFMANPAATYQLNTTSTIILLQKLKPGGSFLYISSSEIYSGLTKSLLTEEDIGTTTPSHTRACYIEGKRGGETICNTFRSQGVRALSARLALAYGPGTRVGGKRVLNSFIEKALRFGKIELMDAGQAIRTYCYISDAVEIMWQTLLYGRQAVYNVGGRSTVSIAELAKLIGKTMNVPVAFPAIETEVPGAPNEVRLDLSRVEKEFQKKDFISLKEGLKKTINWQQDLYK